jgi:uncharacterized glyoxalase superfamily protein PhnB
MISKVTPNLMVPDVDEATKFYELLGFQRVVRVPDEGVADFAILVNGGVELMLQSRDNLASDLPTVSKEPYGGGCVLYMEVEDVQAVHDKIAGSAKVVVDLRDTFYGSREFYILDPNGYTVGFAQPKAE